MLTLMLLLTSVWKVDGNTIDERRESTFNINSFDCNTPAMINKLHLLKFCFIPKKKFPVTVADQALIQTQTRSSRYREVYLRTGSGVAVARYSRVSLPTCCVKSRCVHGAQAETCSSKRIRTANLRLERSNLLISDELTMLFNGTKTEVQWLSGCTPMTLHQTALGTVSIVSGKRSAKLSEIENRDVIKDQDLLPSLKILKHQNPEGLWNLNSRVRNGGCSTRLNVHDDKNYLHPWRQLPVMLPADSAR